MFDTNIYKGETISSKLEGFSDHWKMFACVGHYSRGLMLVILIL